MSSPREAGLVIDGLTVTFSRWGQAVHAVDGLSLEVPRGQWLILVGPNGSGKSSLLRSVGRPLEPQAGRIRLDGEDLLAAPPLAVADRVFYVHQDPLAGTAPVLTVLENLLVADPKAGAGGEARRAAIERYRDLLEPFGLASRLRQPAKLLSGGERQLLALLIASLRPARLILLDEPTAALDPGKEELCLQILSRLHREGRTLVHVSHDESHAAGLGDRTVVLRSGRVVEDLSGPRRTHEALRNHWYA